MQSPAWCPERSNERQESEGRPSSASDLQRRSNGEELKYPLTDDLFHVNVFHETDAGLGQHSDMHRQRLPLEFERKRISGELIKTPTNYVVLERPLSAGFTKSR